MGSDHPESGDDRVADGLPDPDRDDPEWGLHRALEAERHREAARRFFEGAPLYRIDFEPDGTVSLRRKAYAYRPGRPAAEATHWTVLSKHPDLEQAEGRLRHITSPHIYYDERGELARKPRAE